jgi:poly [ADP-ribose] polymerase 2/3/4
MFEEKYLVMITGENNNKFYHMKSTGSNFVVEYGRIGQSVRTETYPQSMFNKKLTEKLRKGYQDKTELYICNKVPSSQKQIEDVDIRCFIDKLLKYSNDSVLNNYTVNVSSVTQKQIDEAQGIINKISRVISGTFNTLSVNEMLLELYHILPRKMKKVKDHLLDKNDKDIIKQMLTKEQDLLDSLSSSMSMANSQQQDDSEEKTILDMLGISVEHCTDKEVSEIKSHMGQISNKFSQAFKVKHHKQSAEFEKFEKMKRDLLWHGTRNENVISILQKSLQIRPANAIHTGSMFSDGIYFANKVTKAMGYTSITGSYWSNGKSSYGYLFVFEVAVGNQKHIYKHDNSCYHITNESLRNEGFDSLYVHGGYDLRNDEFVVYCKSKCNIKYIVEIK